MISILDRIPERRFPRPLGCRHRGAPDDDHLPALFHGDDCL